jgi:hypothetical protein
MKKKVIKKLLLSKKTIANLNGGSMNQIKGGNRDEHDPTYYCGGGGGGTGGGGGEGESYQATWCLPCTQTCQQTICIDC